MSIVLFAMIGAKLNFGTAYWVIFGIFCFLRVTEIICNILKEENL